MAETEEGNSSPPGLWYALCIKKPQYKFPHTAAKGLKYDFLNAIYAIVNYECKAISVSIIVSIALISFSDRCISLVLIRLI